MGKWQEVVVQHRRAEQLVFPLKQEIATVVPLERVVSAWKVGAAPGALLGQLLAALGGVWCVRGRPSRQLRLWTGAC